MKLKNLRRVPMDNMLNLRSLGGFAASGGADECTVDGLIYRSDRPHELSAADEGRISELGIKTIIDLRDDRELRDYPNFYKDYDGISYNHISIMPELSPAFLEKLYATGDHSGGMVEIYKAMLENSGDKILNVFKTIARRITEGGLLFHCTIGRDRTGVVASLILGLAGVDRQDIIADYQVSETYLEKRFTDAFPLWTPGKNMANVLDVLVEDYDGAENYLRKNGLSGDEIKTIKQAFVVKIKA